MEVTNRLTERLVSLTSMSNELEGKKEGARVIVYQSKMESQSKNQRQTFNIT